jgi:radical SAM protein with 4Fe4S-binding SPASM domain
MKNYLPKPLLNQLFQTHKKLETEAHELFYLFFEITRTCNLRCKHCGSDCTSESPSRQLTTTSWIKIIHYLAETFSPSPIIVLTGGEPLMHPDFAKIISAIHQCGLRYGMVSNGYALDETWIERLLSSKMESITISLDGLAKNHNWLRNSKDSFDRVIHALTLLTANKFPLMDVVTCVNPRNLGELDAIAEQLLFLNVKAWRLFRIFPAGRACNNKEILLSFEQTTAMVEWLKTHKKPLSKRGLTVNLSCEGWLPFNEDRQVRDQPFFCRAGVNIASILCDGTITGCSNNPPQFYEGNILRDNFAALWEKGFTKFRNRDWLKKSSCFVCKQVKECQGGSIHLWRNSENRPDFCYVNNVNPL